MNSSEPNSDNPSAESQPPQQDGHWDGLAESIGADVGAPVPAASEEAKPEPPSRRSTRPRVEPSSGWNDLADMFGLPPDETPATTEKETTAVVRGDTETSDREMRSEPFAARTPAVKPPSKRVAPVEEIPSATPSGPTEFREVDDPLERESAFDQPADPEMSPSAFDSHDDEMNSTDQPQSKKSSFWNPFGFFGEGAKKGVEGKTEEPAETPSSSAFSAPAFGERAPKPGRFDEPEVESSRSEFDVSHSDVRRSDADDAEEFLPADESEEQRPRRRRRRRGGRRRGRGAEREEQSVEAADVSDDDMDDEERLLESSAELFDSRDAVLDAEPDVDEEVETETETETEAEADDDVDIRERSESSGRRPARAVDVPAWKDTVGVIVDANLAKRTSRGGGEQRRRRSGRGRRRPSSNGSGRD